MQIAKALAVFDTSVNNVNDYMVRIFLVLLFFFPVMVVAQPLPALIPYKTKQGWGYSDSNRVLRIPGRYSSAELFYDNRAVVTVPENGTDVHCVIDTSGRYIIPPAYHWTGSMYMWSRWARLNARDSAGRWGVIDKDGKIVIPFLYQQGSDTYERPGGVFLTRKGLSTAFMIVVKDGKQGVIDTLNNELVPFRYTGIKMLENNDQLKGWLVQQDTVYGVFNPDGTLLFPVRYERIYPDFGVKRAVVKQQGKMGAIDTAGHIIVPVRYDTLGFPSANGYAVQLNGKWGFFNVSTKRMVPAIYAIYDRAPYSVGKYVIVPQYNSATNERREILLNDTGKVLVPPLYERIIVYKDSIVANTHMRLTEHGEWNEYNSTLHPRTWKPGPWRRGCADCLIVEGPGIESLLLRQNQASIDSNGKRITSFTTKGRTWNVYGYVQKGNIKTGNWQDLYYYGVAAWPENNGDTLYAVVDKRYNYIIGPQSRYKITGGNIYGNWLAVRQKDLDYLVTDTAFNPLTIPVKREPKGYFKWDGKTYMLGYWQPVPVDYYSRKREPCFHCNCLTVLNDRGEVLRGFESYCKVDYRFFQNREAGLLRDDQITVTDSLERQGIVDLNGNICYPRVSFKYHTFSLFAPDMIYVQNRWEDGKFVNKKNKSLFPQIRISNLGSTGSRAFYDNNRYEDTPGLVKVFYYEKDGKNRAFFYLGHRGHIYADL